MKVARSCTGIQYMLSHSLLIEDALISRQEEGLPFIRQSGMSLYSLSLLSRSSSM